MRVAIFAFIFVVMISENPCKVCENLVTDLYCEKMK